MTISRQFYLYVVIAFFLVIGFAIGLTYQFANLSAEGARLIANLERTATLNQELVRGNSEQSDSLRRQLTQLDPSFPDQYRKRNYALGEQYAEYLKLDIGEQERLTVEQIRALQAELSILSMHLYEQLRLGNQAEADVRLNRLSQMESYTRSQFEALNRLQLDKLRAVVDHINQWARQGLLAVFGLVAVLVVIIGTATISLRRRVLHPVGAILEASNRLREGDLGVRVPVERLDELGQLTQGFNFMAESLANSYTTLEDKVVERTAQIQSMQRQLIQAEKMSAVGLLVSGVAHELNNPLSAIMGFAELAKMEFSASGGHGQGIRLLQELDSQVERCRRIVANLLQFARQQEPHLEAIEVNVVVDQVLQLREYELETRNVRLVREFDPSNPVLRADRGKIQQVVLNLLNNAHDAIRETDQPGTIWVRTRAESDTVILEFLDDGPGFDDAERACDPFYTTKDVGKGTGLGLSVCYGIVQEHHGALVARNWEKGAQITITLPIGEPVEPNTPVPPVPPEPVQLNTPVPPVPPEPVQLNAHVLPVPPEPVQLNAHVLPVPPAPVELNTPVLPVPPEPVQLNAHVLPVPPEPAELNAPVLPVPPEPAELNAPVLPVPPEPEVVRTPPELCALVVDDEEMLLRLQKSFLAKMGIRAVGVTSGEEAMRHLQHHRVDIVISDVRMPGRVDGVQLHAWVGLHQPHLASSFVFVSGDVVGANLGDLAQRTGVARIAKPFRYEEYANVVRQTLAAGGRHS